MVAGGELTHVHSISVVVPVYQGEDTLESLIEDLCPFTEVSKSPAGHLMQVTEIVLVYDNGPDRSDEVIRRLCAANDIVHPVWLSRNFGQHAATIAGMSATGSEWIVTMDEDGQFAAEDIAKLLDTAVKRGAQLVYGKTTLPAPHGRFRNSGSRAAKAIARWILKDQNIESFSSFRLMLGEVGRGVAAYVGPGVYLDIALSWAFGPTEVCPVEFRQGHDRPSGYSTRKLFTHFWQLIVTAGPRPLRLVSLAGVTSAIAGVVLAFFILTERLVGNVKVAGWTSLAVIILFLGGMTLFALGIIAEYVGAAVRMAMGKPLYLVTSDPATNPAQRDRFDDESEKTNG